MAHEHRSSRGWLPRPSALVPTGGCSPGADRAPLARNIDKYEIARMNLKKQLAMLSYYAGMEEAVKQPDL